MNKSSFWWWLFIILIIGGILWWFGWFNKSNSFIFNFSNSLDNPQIFQRFSKKINQPNLVKKTVSTLFNKTASFPEKIVSNAIQSVKNFLAESAKKGAGELINSFQQDIGLKSAAPVNEPPLSVALIGSKDKPFYFIVKSNDGNSSYAIDLGDGNKLTGSVIAGEKKILEHTWQISGTYLVTAEVTSTNSEVRKFSFPIIVE